MAIRLVVLAFMFFGTSAYATRALRPEVVPLRQSLSTLPLQLGQWRGRDTQPFTPDILAVLGVDDYISRFYSKADGTSLVSLYLGYYQSQRTGDTIHSPLNCLPGAGWQPITTGQIAIDVGQSSPIVVNRFVIQKGSDRQVALYWYQSHGRVVASEYWSKAYLVWDAARTRRSDAAMIRVISPVVALDGSDAAAERRTVEFVQALFPRLGTYLPS